jgi:hypothetical protein
MVPLRILSIASKSAILKGSLKTQATSNEEEGVRETDVDVCRSNGADSGNTWSS